jgi:hypothetical protein
MRLATRQAIHKVIHSGIHRGIHTLGSQRWNGFTSCWGEIGSPTVHGVLTTHNRPDPLVGRLAEWLQSGATLVQVQTVNRLNCWHW